MDNKTHPSAPAAGLLIGDSALARDLQNELAANGIDTAFSLAPSPTIDTVLKSGLPALDHGLCFADITGEADKDAAVTALARALPENVRLVVINNNASLDALHHFRALGAADYWAAPVNVKAMVDQSLALGINQHRASVNRRSLFFIDTAYGAGAGLLSSIAASALSDARLASILVDTDYRRPTCSGYLGLDVNGNLPVLLDAGERIDNTLVAQAVTAVSGTLHLLDGFSTSEALPEGPALSNLAQRLKYLYMRQIWRFSAAVAPAAIPLDAANAVVILLDGSLGGLKTAAALRERLKREPVNAPVLWVLNQRDAAQTVPAEMIEKHLGIKLDLTIGHYKKLNQALIEPAALLSGNNPVTRGVKRILALTDSSAAAGKADQPWWRALWK